ncbi:hypothetical protein GCM10027018_02500 [Paenibacillus thermoaerophilus]
MLQNRLKLYRLQTGLKSGGRARVEHFLGFVCYMREGKPFHDEFLQTNERFYDARIEQLDFDDPGAVDTINHWVK